jgi:DNA polymerase-3 subunit alpha
MASMRKRFVEGCGETNNIPAKKAEKIFNDIEQFAGYGFNKSHSAAYAVISYQTAYLKAHHPVAFMAALMSIDMGNPDKLPPLIAEAQEMGIEVTPPCVNRSRVRFQPEGDAIRFGMAGVKNVGVAAVEALVQERERGGPYTGLVDFCSRIDAQACNRKALESMIKCGAFDFTGMSRGRLFGGLDFAMSRAAATQRDRAAGQASLFDMMEGEAEATDEDLPPGEAWPEQMMLAAEKELIGFYISGHPLREHAWVLDNFSLADTSRLEETESGTMTRIGGLVTQFQKRFTRQKQEAMGVFRLEHLHGTAEVVVFPESFSLYGLHLVEEAPVMVCGKLLRDEGIRIQAVEIYPLPEVPKQFTTRLSLHLPAGNLLDRHLQAVHDILRRNPGETRVVICLQYPGGEKVFVDTDRAFRVTPSAGLCKALEEVLGEESVYVGVQRAPCKRPPNGRGHRR